MIIKYNKDYLLSIFFILTFLLSNFTNFLKGFEGYLEISNTVQIVIYIRYFCLLGGLIIAYKSISNKFFLIVNIPIILIMIINSILFPDNNKYLFKTIHSFIPIIIIMLMLISIKDYKKLFQNLYYLSVVYCFIIICYLFSLISIGKLFVFGHADTYMSYAYSVLPCICCFAYKVFDSNFKDIKAMVLFILSFTSICVWGCRGAVLSVICYLIILYTHKCSNEKKIHHLIIIPLFVMLMTVLLVNNLDKLNDLTDKLGIHSRMIKKIISGNSDSGRSKLYKKAIEEIDREPINPRGINADYRLLGGYAHNIFIELIYDFGGIIGSLLTLYILFMAGISILLLYKNLPINNLIIYLFSISFFRLLVSFSLFLDFSFWCWIILSLKKLSPQKT